MWSEKDTVIRPLGSCAGASERGLVKNIGLWDYPQPYVSLHSELIVIAANLRQSGSAYRRSRSVWRSSQAAR